MKVPFYLCLLIGLFLISPLAVNSEKARFDNYRLYELKIDTEEQLIALKSLPTGINHYELLDQPSVVGQNVEIIVPPTYNSQFEQLSKDLKMSTNLLIPDLQRLIDDEGFKSRADFGWDAYYTLSEIYEWMDSLPGSYPGVVTKIVGGTTYEGRSIEGVLLSKNPSNPGIFIEANIHAREWITSASTTWIINELLTSSDPEIQGLLNNYNWYIFPVTNPDGFEYSHTDYRLWRKTRSRPGLICFGIDPNRNWDANWQIGGPGASDDICSETYGGTHAFSEIETLSLSNYIESVRDKINVYLSFHSAAQMILFPWGHTNVHTTNHDDLMDVAEAAYTRLNSIHGTVYTYGTTYETIYPATGVSPDWAYEALEIPLAYTYEFRGRFQNGTTYSFVAPPSEIIPNAEEVLQSLIALTDKAEELNYMN